MNVSRRCKQRPRIIPRNRGLRISLPCPNHNSVDPYMDPAVTISSVSFCEQCSQGPCWSSTLITAVGGRGHSITASHLNRRHMKRDEKESLKCFHSTCSYLHPYLPTISLKEWGVGGWGEITGLRRQLQLIRNVRGLSQESRQGNHTIYGNRGRI